MTHSTLQIKILNKQLQQNIDLPHYATPGSAGLDLRACIEAPQIIEPNQAILIPTGLAIHLQDPKRAAMILPRSGLGHKHGIILGNSVGLIDSDYQGELKISCWNRSDTPYTIQPTERIAQLVIIPIEQVKLQVVKHFETSNRGSGGFGSSGKH